MGIFLFSSNNILLYSTLREFSRPEEYNSETDTYTKKKADTDKAKKLCAVLAVSKIVETVHTLIAKEDLDNGIMTEEMVLPEPFISFDENGSPVYGLSLTFRF
jgi:hypothetical protein